MVTRKHLAADRAAEKARIQKEKEAAEANKQEEDAKREFVYCSTDCVRKHQRELTAAAAMARFK